MMGLLKTLEKFAQSDDFVKAVLSSTEAGFAGSGYSVEVFENGSWRVLWDNQIGNLYVSPGMIVPVPQLTQEQHDEADDDDNITLKEVVEFYRDELVAELLDGQTARMEVALQPRAYVYDTLDTGTGEQRARFINEFSEEERGIFVALWLRDGDKDDLLRSVPEAESYL